MTCNVWYAIKPNQIKPNYKHQEMSVHDLYYLIAKIFFLNRK